MFIIVNFDFIPFVLRMQVEMVLRPGRVVSVSCSAQAARTYTTVFLSSVVYKIYTSTVELSRRNMAQSV